MTFCERFLWKGVYLSCYRLAKGVLTYGETVSQLAASLQHNKGQARQLLRATIQKVVCWYQLRILVINESDLTFIHLYITSLYVSVINHDAVLSVEYDIHNNWRATCNNLLSAINRFLLITTDLRCWGREVSTINMILQMSTNLILNVQKYSDEWLGSRCVTDIQSIYMI